MCGGSSYSPPRRPKEPSKNYEHFWNTTEGGFAVELVKGCNNAKCTFVCEARRKRETISITPAVFNKYVLPLKMGSSDFFLMYGSGDVSNYPLKELDDNLSGCQFNLRADSVDEDTLSKLHKGKIILNVYNNSDAIKANTFKRFIHAVHIPVSKNIDYKGVFSFVRVPVVFRGIDESNVNHVIPEEFQEEMLRSFGLKIDIELLNPIPSFRPVIESVSIKKTMVMYHFRRCFRGDSKKVVIAAPIKSIEDRVRTGKHIEKFISFVLTLPECEKCTIAWKGTWEE